MFYLLSKFVDSILWLIKWPLAGVMLYWYLDIFSFFVAMLLEFLYQASWVYVAGAIVFIVTNFLGNYSNNRFLIWEHEMSHFIFARLTFKQNVRIEVYPEGESDYKGRAGYCYYENGDNWLIAIAPYFFPTLTLLLSLLYLLPIGDLNVILDFCLGFSIAYHLKTNFIELYYNFSPSIKGGKTDITELGKTFAFIMIPPLNFVVFSIVIIALI